MNHTTDYAEKIVEELTLAMGQISSTEADALADRVLSAKKIFVAGAGRSGLMGKSFVMRMMHMGLDAYAVGETVTPNFEKEDLLIIGSGSGETRALIPMAEKAKEIGGHIAAVTLSPASTLGKAADMIVKLPGASKDRSTGDFTTIQPMGSLFEQTMLVFYDAVILRVMSKQGLNSQKMYGRHANLE